MKKLIKQWLNLELTVEALISSSDKVNKEFFLNPTLEVAHSLIGKIFVKIENNTVLAGIISETEAYLDSNDRASHSYRGISRKNDAMFYEGGVLYIYKIFGIHYCANIVTEPAGIGCAVLLRSLIPISGINIMQRRRRTTDIYNLCRGPGNLAKAFSLDYTYNKNSLLSDNLYLLNTELDNQYFIANSGRIGISKDDHLPYRFFIYECPFISGKKSIKNAQKILNS